MLQAQRTALQWAARKAFIAAMLSFCLAIPITVDAARSNPSKSDSRIYPGAAWETAARPDRLGWSLQKLLKARAYAQRIGSAAVMVVDDGLVVAQWGNVAFNYPVHSIRKPFFSALAGIVVHEKRIDLSDTLEDLGIDDVNPSLTVSEKQATVMDLLASRSGVYHPAVGETAMMKQLRPRRGSHAPGSFWYYNNWDFNVVGSIIEKKTGGRIFDLFIKRIADPVQMQDFNAGNGKYVYGSESLHRGYAFRMSTRDLARFGLLYLRKGKWLDRHILPSDWVALSTATHSKIGNGAGYGYLWRTAVDGGLTPNVRLQRPCFFHSGNLLHFLVVIPHRNLVIVHRVNTDARGPYPRLHQIGRLFWMILDAAGEKHIGPDPSLQKADGEPLTGNALIKTLVNKQFQFDSPGYLVEGRQTSHTVQFMQDSIICIEPATGTRMRGRWTIAGGRCCIEMAGISDCYAVLYDYQQVRLYDSTGTLFATLQFDHR